MDTETPWTVDYLYIPTADQYEKLSTLLKKYEVDHIKSVEKLPVFHNIEYRVVIVPKTHRVMMTKLLCLVRLAFSEVNHRQGPDRDMDAPSIWEWLDWRGLSRLGPDVTNEIKELVGVYKSPHNSPKFSLAYHLKFWEQDASIFFCGDALMDRVLMNPVLKHLTLYTPHTSKSDKLRSQMAFATVRHEPPQYRLYSACQTQSMINTLELGVIQVSITDFPQFNSFDVHALYYSNGKYDLSWARAFRDVDTCLAAIQQKQAKVISGYLLQSQTCWDGRQAQVSHMIKQGWTIPNVFWYDRDGYWKEKAEIWQIRRLAIRAQKELDETKELLQEFVTLVEEEEEQEKPDFRNLKRVKLTHEEEDRKEENE